MVGVTLRVVTASAVDEVLALRLRPEQQPLIADNLRSLAQAGADPALTAFAAYDEQHRGLAEPSEPPVGFAVTEVRAGVGFILRLMVDAEHQGVGYGRALLAELVRRLRLLPEVEMVATSHRPENVAMASLCRAAGFVDWPVPWDAGDEVFLQLPR